MDCYFDEQRAVEVEVPINIALIKYWGKRNEDLILPLNSSLSLNIDGLVARTRLRCSSKISDSVTVNNTSVDLEKSKRFRKCFDYARQLIRGRSCHENTGPHLETEYGFEVSSTTNFPVGAGLASSAAGFAAIAVSIGELFDLSMVDVSSLARIGSGSACRSVFGGLVEWYSGSDQSGSDCVVKQVFPENWWPELCALIVVLDPTEKEVGSSIGMRRSVETSELLKHRINEVVPKRIERLKVAFQSRDFDEFARITMADSNQLHAICLDTCPPLKYMSDASWYVVRAVNEFNSGNRRRAAYSFDAGPNACIFVENNNVVGFLQQLCRYFKFPPKVIFNLESIEDHFEIPQDVNPSTSFAIRDIIVSEVGGSPRIIT
ncbi:diphosphomevalonate decarboxylase [Necator americanus]|uniref:Diphosphomevalonate decarboxylase n=1 Tax=Necator americanus TaxID=51031 RepID=W2SM03_NECAM|nr:diphosphomevalonate decarboxylase [Necator americanus]ETN70704.1 diphosphomevalonate decarboxylase [Necator americanus]